MFRRLYIFKKKHVRKDGTVTIGPNRQWKWIKRAVPYRKQTRGKPKTMLSKRFGYLENYNRKEQQMLKCPSGYSVSQGMNALRKLWRAYFGELNAANVAGMQKRARAIQEVQEDMGLKTSSFPHLGIYGDNLIFYDKDGKVKTEIDHSELKEKEEMEEAKERLHEAVERAELSLEPDVNDIPVEQGGNLITIPDEIPPPQINYDDEEGKEQERQQHEPRYRIKHSNRMRYGKKRDEEWTCELCGDIVPPKKSHICGYKEEEDVITMTDDIPFQSQMEFEETDRDNYKEK